MFATAIHADVPFAELRGYLRQALAPWKLELNGRGSFIGEAKGSGLRVRCAIVPPESYAGRPWHRVAHPCPFVGPLAGYLRWETMDGAYDLASSRLPVALLREGRGTTARIEDGRTVEAIALRRWKVRDVLDKYGFDDGAALLTRDEGPYQEQVMTTVQRATEEAGFDAYLNWASTSHNPLRLGWWQPEGSERFSPALWDRKPEEPRLVDPYHALVGLSVEVWTYDFSSLDEGDFWSAAGPRNGS
jgi:hypothetical protein